MFKCEFVGADALVPNELKIYYTLLCVLGESFCNGGIHVCLHPFGQFFYLVSISSAFSLIAFESAFIALLSSCPFTSSYSPLNFSDTLPCVLLSFFL